METERLHTGGRQFETGKLKMLKMAIDFYQMVLLRQHGKFHVTEAGKSIIIRNKKYSDYIEALNALKK